MFRFFRHHLTSKLKFTFTKIFFVSTGWSYFCYRKRLSQTSVDEKARKYIKKLSLLSTPYTQGGLKDMTIEVDKDVYPFGKWSQLYSQFIVDHYDLIEKKVIDAGTSTGGTAIKMAKAGANVIAFDISPNAVNCAKKNIALNHVENQVKVVLSDGLSYFKNDLGRVKKNERSQYSLFVSGTPWSTIESDDDLKGIDANENYWIKLAFFDPQDKFIHDIMQYAPDLMTDDGKILITGCKENEDRLKRLCQQNNMLFKRVSGFDVHHDKNIHYIYELEKKLC